MANFDDEWWALPLWSWGRVAGLGFLRWNVVSRDSTPATIVSLSSPAMPDPLEGITLKTIITELVDAYGWETLAADIRIRCFTHDPSITSSLHFLRRTPWARAKVEELYRQHLATNRFANPADQPGSEP